MTLSVPFRSQLKSLLLRALRGSARDERGATLVETAISMMTVMMLIFTVIEGSLEIYSFHFIANAAHEGTRYAIVRGSSWGTNTCDGTGSAGSGYGGSACVASTNDIANYVASLNFPGMNLTSGDVCVEYYAAASMPTTPTTTCTGNSSPNDPGDIVQVTITYPFTLTVPLLPSYTFNLKSTSSMTIAQ